jgi:hypothetical protein
VSEYRVFLLSLPRVWQLYCIENMHLLALPMTATVITETIKERLCGLMHFTCYIGSDAAFKEQTPVELKFEIRT